LLAFFILVCPHTYKFGRPSSFFFAGHYLMKTLTTSFILVAWLAMLRSAAAVVVDFEDLATTTYSVGNSFDSGGVKFDVVAYNGAGSSLNVSKSGSPLNTRLFMNNSIGVRIAFTAFASSIAFDFSDQCSGCSATGITVNGVASNPAIDLPLLNGTTLGGASISISPPSNAAFQNRLTVNGIITSLTAGGTEFSFDNLTILVPEPATPMLILTGAIASLRTRLRRR
jgi:hypothetical protein